MTEDAISGTLNYVTGYTGFSSETELQSGNYLALTFANNDFDKYSSIKVGLVPSAIGMDLVEIINDPDKNGVFRVTSNDQVFKIQATDIETGETTEKSYSLSDLVLED